MNIFTLNHEPNKENLKKFGLVLGTILVVIFGGIYPFIFKKEIIFWPIGIGSILIALAYLFPYVFKPIFIIFSITGNILGPINQFLLLTSIFYIIVFPINFILWIFRYDPMKRALDKRLKTYRIVNHRKINVEEPF
jgi:hypothetical protein